MASHVIEGYVTTSHVTCLVIKLLHKIGHVILRSRDIQKYMEISRKIKEKLEKY
jgi:hypothetical protein